MNSMNINTRLSQELGARVQQIEAAVALLDEGATVPFIARYRKEVTGGLDDTQLRLLDERLVYLRKLFLSMLTAILFLLSGAQVYADNNDKLENTLSRSLQLNKNKTARVGSSSDMIKAYQKAGIINEKYDSDIDYRHNYIVKKPAQFMGHNLIIIQAEYMNEYSGCCANDGTQLVFKVNGSVENLQQFSFQHECALKPVDMKEVIQDEDLPQFKTPAGEYGALTCSGNLTKIKINSF